MEEAIYVGTDTFSFVLKGKVKPMSDCKYNICIKYTANPVEYTAEVKLVDLDGMVIGEGNGCIAPEEMCEFLRVLIKNFCNEGIICIDRAHINGAYLLSRLLHKQNADIRRNVRCAVRTIKGDNGTVKVKVYG